ncbi:MAG: 3-oxoacyl-ACP reductase [Clostridiales bacterium]|nr:MAG: 3-oxoacyl-ACP reductase [Clostridiales bacterium]
MRLEKKSAIVTGGASGIGASICKKLAEHGANIAVWDINESGLKEIKSELSGYDVKVECYKTNVTDYENAQEVGMKTIADFGKIDILVNCAGGGKDLALGFRELDAVTWKKQMDLNLNSAFNCSKAVMEHMVEQRYGKIVNIASVAGMRGGGLLGKGAYSTAKAGIMGFTKAMAKELGEFGIYVNSVAPGMHITPLITKNMTEERIQELKNDLPLKTAGEPEKLAELIAFLASDDAQFITGSLVVVDGGYAMY